MSDTSLDLPHVFLRLKDWEKTLLWSAVPKHLYHYTTFDGLQGILSSDSLRATYNQALNDGTEWTYGQSVIKKHAVSADMRKQLEPPPHYLSGSPKALFVACFCEGPDLLSMWRSYTSAGGGYCIGFDSGKIRELEREATGSGPFGGILVKIVYGEWLPKELKELLDSGEHVLAEWLFASMIKDLGFREEQEWRIVVPDPPSSVLTFHAGNSTIKASVQLKLPRAKLPITSVTCGPTLRTEAQEAVKWMLDKYGYKQVRVTGCEIPFRL